MIESVQLIATYAFTIVLVALAPRLLFVLMCLAAGYPFLGLVAMAIMAVLTIVRN